MEDVRFYAFPGTFFDDKHMPGFWLNAPLVVNYTISPLVSLFCAIYKIVELIKRIQIVQPYLGGSSHYAETLWHSHMKRHGHSIFEVDP